MKVSVIMPTYNNEKYLDAAIQSILNQTFKDFEFIIIEDGSKDNSVEVIKKYLSDKRTKFIQNKENLGLIKNLNNAIEMSQGEYIARMDGDDISELDRLEKQVEYLDKHPNVGLLGTQGIVINEKGEKTGDFHRHTTDFNLRMKLMDSNAFIHGSVMMRRKYLEKTNRYNPEHERSEDYGLWLQFIKVCKVANLPDVLYQWRSYGDFRIDNEELMRRQEESYSIIKDKVLSSNKYIVEKILHRIFKKKK